MRYANDMLMNYVFMCRLDIILVMSFPIIGGTTSLTRLLAILASLMLRFDSCFCTERCVIQSKLTLSVSGRVNSYHIAQLCLLVISEVSILVIICMQMFENMLHF